LIFCVLTQLAASGLILIMLGLIQKKIFVWPVGFWGGKTYGWHYESIFILMNLVILFTDGGASVLKHLPHRSLQQRLQSHILLFTTESPNSYASPDRQIIDDFAVGEQHGSRSSGDHCSHPACLLPADDARLHHHDSRSTI
jgi:hypothetical protein